MGSVVGKSASTAETKLEAKIVNSMKRRATQGSGIKSFNTVILKFPKIDHSLRQCKATFELFDQDSNGAIDQQEMKHCFHNLGISFTEDELADFFNACDFNQDMGIKFSEFVVLLCLVYLLKDDQVALHTKLKSAVPQLESTLETLVDAFVFLDTNKDGYVSKSEMVKAINETSSGERSSGQIAMTRFEEMDWDKNGAVNFNEFLFAFTRWVGIDDADQDDHDQV